RAGPLMPVTILPMRKVESSAPRRGRKIHFREVRYVSFSNQSALPSQLECSPPSLAFLGTECSRGILPLPYEACGVSVRIDYLREAHTVIFGNLARIEAIALPWSARSMVCRFQRPVERKREDFLAF